MTSLTLTQARLQLGELVNCVAHEGDRIVIRRNGKPRAVLISIEDAALLKVLEDKADIAAAKKALKEDKFYSLEEVKDELGI